MTAELTMQYAGWLLFLWVFANQGGVPVPVVPSLMAAGALLGGSSGLSFVLIVVVAVAAALCADLLWYVLGRWHGAEALSVLCRATSQPTTCVDRAEHLFRAHELRFQFWARFLPELNPIAAGLAGAAGVAVGRYVLIASGSALAWAGTWTSAGYLLKDVMHGLAAHIGIPIVALVMLALAGWVAGAYLGRRRAEDRHV